MRDLLRQVRLAERKKIEAHTNRTCFHNSSLSRKKILGRAADRYILDLITGCYEIRGKEKRGEKGESQLDASPERKFIGPKPLSFTTCFRLLFNNRLLLSNYYT